MKGVIILLLFVSQSLGLKAQAPCPTVCDTFYYIRITVVPQDAYPIFLDGLSKQNDLTSINLQNLDSLQNSFLRIAHFSPGLTSGSYASLLKKCMGDSLSKQYANNHKSEPYNTINKIERKTVVKKGKLKTGETVQYKISKIAGKFFELTWDSIEGFSDSNQMNVTAGNKTKKVLYPFEICLFEKPKN